jgi:hypothetical protein
LLAFTCRHDAMPTRAGWVSCRWYSPRWTKLLPDTPISAVDQGKGSSFLLPQRRAVNGGDKEESSGEASPNADSDQRWN